MSPDDHEFITRKSYINYREERLHPLSSLEEKDRNGFLSQKGDVRKEVMEKIHEGAELTPFLSYEAIELLQNQGFIEENQNID